MKIVFTCLLWLIFSFNSISQETTLGIDVGAGQFNMADFKNINQTVVKGLYFDARITDNFPMNIVYKPFIHKTFKNKWGFGIKYSLSSSGSLISREDYSGSYFFKNQTRYSSPGFTIDYCLGSIHKFRFIVYNDFGWEFSNSKMHESLIVSSLFKDEMHNYRSTNIYTEPGFRIEYPYKDFFRFGFYTGYLIDKQGEIKEATSVFNLKELYDLSKHGNSMNWSGIRFGVSFSFKFPED